MPTVYFEEEDKTIEVADGVSILDACNEIGIHLDHACGGVCACSTCHVWVNKGFDNLSELEEDEEDRLDGAQNVTMKSRLGCQALIHGDISVKLPNQKGLH
ncbi:MAG: 2Fe-2S ferredoxin [Candidatus Cloacimonadota bacterium]|nr:MAG: 2Fe-2S ferredoxin [Candidatus Cloacimonadota bacterium]PCJ20134.1 MAG: 2Fe-2S ferredoxin [Candidatus Cloacimonadota bacterium]